MPYQRYIYENLIGQFSVNENSGRNKERKCGLVRNYSYFFFCCFCFNCCGFFVLFLRVLCQPCQRSSIYFKCRVCVCFFFSNFPFHTETQRKSRRKSFLYRFHLKYLRIYELTSYSFAQPLLILFNFSFAGAVATVQEITHTDQKFRTMPTKVFFLLPLNNNFAWTFVVERIRMTSRCRSFIFGYNSFYSFWT